MKCLVLLSISLAVASANFPTKPTNLKTTFGVPLNPFGNAYESQPRTEREALDYGYSRINTGGCSETFLGNAYGHPDEPSFVVLFDVAGYIAGVQNVVLTSAQPTVPLPAYQLGTFFGQEAWFNTAYFVDPEIICDKGRTEAQWEEQGTADRLWFQDGPIADRNFVKIPLTQEGADSEARWYKHFCFIGMGTHYMEFNYDPDQDCDTVFPIHILYDQGVITGFVWQQNVFLPGDRWEHPDHMAVSLIVDRPPKCLDEYTNSGSASTLHHFFYDHPWLTQCIF